jgi:hypothetical protein
MDVARIVLGYVQALVWPIAVVVLLIYYLPVIRGLLPGTRIRLTLAGVTVETTLEALRSSIEESVWDEEITAKQWSRLERLRREGRVEFKYDRDYGMLMPLRNAGLIRAIPRGFLTVAKAVEPTPLGRLLLEARDHQRSRE